MGPVLQKLKVWLKVSSIELYIVYLLYNLSCLLIAYAKTSGFGSACLHKLKLHKKMHIIVPILFYQLISNSLGKFDKSEFSDL